MHDQMQAKQARINEILEETIQITDEITTMGQEKV